MTAEWKTAKVLELIRHRRAAGVSFGVIAAEIGNGISTNAVIGAAHRAGHLRGPRIVDPRASWTPADHV